MGEGRSETRIGGDQGAFQSTLWSVVLKARDLSSHDRRQALQSLIQTYWKPLYLFIRRKGNGVDTSKDLTQGFFAALLEKDFLKYVDRDRGKFRTFLLTALEHYMADEFDRARAQKRGGGESPLSLDFKGAELEVPHLGTSTPDQAFTRDWAIWVMAQAMEALKGAYVESGRAAEFEAFRLHLTTVRPKGSSYEEVGRLLGISIEDVRNRVRSARAGYREAILQVIRSYTESAGEAREELQDLLAAFS